MSKKQNPKAPIEKPIARTKLKRPRRQQAKQQTTVRLDRGLIASAMKRAEREGLRLTDVVEEGIDIWIQARGEKSADAVRLRFLCNHLPQHLEQQTLAFLAFYAWPRKNMVEEEYRKGLDRILMTFRQHPDYKSCLKKLGTLPKDRSLEAAAG